MRHQKTIETRLWLYAINNQEVFSKGQEISEWMYEVVTLPKKWSKKLEKFCPIVSGKNTAD